MRSRCWRALPRLHRSRPPIMPSTHQASAQRRPRGRLRGRHRRDGECTGRLSAGRVLLAAMLLGTILRLYQLEALDLAYDESATGNFSALPSPDLWGPPAVLETNPPLYYSLAWLVHRCGGTLERDPLCLRARRRALHSGHVGAGRSPGQPLRRRRGCLVATSASQSRRASSRTGCSLLALAVLVGRCCPRSGPPADQRLVLATHLQRRGGRLRGGGAGRALHPRHRAHDPCRVHRRRAG